MADWSVGVLGNDGFIYCVPDTATEILRYDPKTRAISTFGEGSIDVGTHKWSGALLAGNGRIYCVPWCHPQVLVIDPAASSVSFLDTISGTGGVAASLAEHKWRDCVLAKDGRIYCVPWTAEAVLCIDTEANTATCFGRLPEGESKWAGAVLADDGRIFCAPYDSRSVLCISPADRTVACLGDFGPARRKWRGAVAAGDGLIYMVPYNALEVLVVEPSLVAALVAEADDTAIESKAAALGPEQLEGAAAKARALAAACMEDSDDEAAAGDRTAPPPEETSGVPGLSCFGWVGGIRCKWRGGVLARDGSIYCVPDCAGEVLCIQPGSKEVTTFGPVGNGRWKWRGGVLGADGKIYCAPYEPHENGLCIDPAKRRVTPVNAFDGAGLRLPGFISAPDVLCVPLC